MAEVTTAEIGVTVGGNVMPRPIDPSYATFPDIAKKGVVDLIQLFERNYLNTHDAGDDEFESSFGQVYTPEKPRVSDGSGTFTIGNTNKIVQIGLFIAAIFIIGKFVRAI